MMQILKAVKDIKTCKNLVVTVGSFDGVHLGHLDIFSAVKAKAKELDGESMIITFDPHPQVVLHPDADFFQITPFKEKIALLEQQDIDYLSVIPFTHQFSALTFEDFVKGFLIDKLNIRALVMGPNHSMGRNRVGKTQSIKELCESNGIDVTVVPELLIDGQPVRSSEIRKLIHEVDFERASELLGRRL